jgi:hypothetical protein
MTDRKLGPERASRAGLGWRTLAAALACYLVAALIGTYPAVWTFGSRFPGSRCDPLQALRVMRWYKDWLHGDQPLLLCPGLQYPVGAPLGNFSPLHFQALLYLPLSLTGADDILCYNLIWLSNLVFTAMGTFLLAWHVLGDRWCAGFAGLAAMLSGPMLLHALGHLELITLGWVPLFVVGWMHWVDRPTWRGLFAAVVLYVLVAASAAYFAVFALAPAGLYLVWSGAREGGRGLLLWWRARVGWLLVFGVLAGACLAVLFYPQLWSRAHGYAAPRGTGEFFRFRAPLWSYVLPSALHPLGRGWPASETCYDEAGFFPVESCSYLGVVVWLLMVYAAVARVRFPQVGYWWLLLLTCVVLSLGPSCDLFGCRLPMPAGWLQHWFFPIRLLRAPARFNLFAAVFAAVLAAAGLRRLLAQLNRPTWRGVLFAGCCAAALADLGLAPFVTAEMPSMPGCYDFMLRRRPGASFLEAPQRPSGEGSDLNAACGYWQSHHHGRTTAGYSGFSNRRADDLLLTPSPFARDEFLRDDFLTNSATTSISLASDVRFDDYAWLYLAVHHLDFVVLHKKSDLVGDCLAGVERLWSRWQAFRIFEDEATVVYDLSLLGKPQRPTPLCTDGWHYRIDWHGLPCRLVSHSARLSLFNPDAERPLVLVLEGMGFREKRTVRLCVGNRELAVWQVTPDQFQTCSSPPFRLPAGVTEVSLESDGDSRPAGQDWSAEGDRNAYSLRVASIRLEESTSIVP